MDNDVDLQRAIYASLASIANRQRRAPPAAPRPRPAVVGGGGGAGRATGGRRNTLEREGIAPTRGAPPAPARPIRATRSPDSRAVPGRRLGGAEARPDTRPPFFVPFEGDDAKDVAALDERPLPRPTDRISGWQEISSGGRVQRQSQTHLLFVCETVLDDAPLAFPSAVVTALHREESIRSTKQQVTFQTQVKNLSARGKYSMVVVGLTDKPPPACEEIIGVAMHYDPWGTQYASTDVWHVVRGPIGEFRVLERMEAIERNMAVRQKHDGTLLSITITREECLSIAINGEIITSRPVPRRGLSVECSYPILLSAGGRISLKNIAMGDASEFPVPIMKVPTAALQGRTQSTGGGGHSAHGASPPAKPRAKTGAAPPNPTRAEPQKSFEGDPFAAAIESEIIDRSPNVSFNDIAGLDQAKALLNEAVVLPLVLPEFFTGLRTPWKGVLMFGPPGTGKTMLAKAVASAGGTTFFNISSSTLVSRFHGESEKMVRALFQVARARAPSTVFFDEIDALMSRRGSGNEHEASRRLKAEMLQQIDGVSSVGEARVMILATTNFPWDLDDAMCRRLEKRIYIPLPDLPGRRAFFQRQAKQCVLERDVDIELLAQRSEGYSFADLATICRDAAMMPMRRLIADRSPQDIAAMKQRGELQRVPPICAADFNDAFTKVQPSVPQSEVKKHTAWGMEFGSS